MTFSIDTFGTTYYWDQEVFEEMLENWENDWNGKARGIDVFIGPRKQVIRNFKEKVCKNVFFR